MDLFDLIWPFSCIHCGKLGKILCSDCQNLLPNLPPQLCAGCKRIVKPWHLCPYCKRRLKPISQLFTLGEFQNPFLKQAIWEIKFQHQKNLIYPLAEKLAQKIQASALKFDLLIPIPLSKKTERKRGYNQSLTLAKVLAKLLQKEFLEKIVIKTKDNLPQRDLPRRLREKNVAGVFRVQNQEKIEGKKIVLVDDVITTGATLKEVAKILKERGAKKVMAVTLAREF